MKKVNRTNNYAHSTKISIKTLIGTWDKTSWILLIVPVLLTLWVYFGKQDFFNKSFGNLINVWNQDFYSTVYEYLCAFILMFVVPFIFIKFFFKDKLINYGFKKGDSRFGLKFCLFSIPIILGLMYIGAGTASVQIEYPLAKSITGNINYIIIIELFYLVYYISWEFFFRGVMLFGLEQKYGALVAILIQTIPSTIVHIGKPFGETMGAVIGGLVFGYLALRTRSILYPFILHALLGISTDIFVILRTIH
ncbi:MAG: CPBP family intramembrane glutamic endopeptidase [bacterium]